jgi:alkylation response protein AidB-like acyl-CoA dehydrogenase
MRGTGSKDVVLENTFIPEHYAAPMIEAQMGTVPGVDIPLYRLPIRPALATMLLGTIVGMADRGLQLFIDKTRGRRDVYTGAMKSDNAGVRRRVAEASVEISCAWALTQQNCDLLEDAMLHDRRCRRRNGRRSDGMQPTPPSYAGAPATGSSKVPVPVPRMTATACRSSSAT